MVYAIYLASLGGPAEPILLHSRSFFSSLPIQTSALDSLCTFNLQGVDTITAESEEDPQQLLRAYEGNDVLDYVLREGKTEYTGSAAQTAQKDKKKDFVSGTFRMRDSHLLVHWMATLKGTALMMIVAPTVNPSIVRSNLRSILTSLASRIRLDQPREVLVKPHVVALTLKYYVPCGQLLLQPPAVQKQIEEAISKLLK